MLKPAESASASRGVTNAQAALVFIGRTGLRRHGADERTDAAPRFEYTAPLEIAVDAGDGVRVDAQCDRELPHRRQLIARMRRPAAIFVNFYRKRA